MSGSVTVAQAIARLRTFSRKELRRATKEAFHQALSVGRERALGVLKKTTVGVAVQRRGNVQLALGLKSRSKKWRDPNTLAMLQQSTIPLVVRRSEMKDSWTSGSLRSGLETMGFAALIEAGSRTKAHQIKRIRLGGYSRKWSTRAKQVEALPPLTFQVGGRWVSKRVVTHPGSRVPRNPFLDSGADAAEAALPARFEGALERALEAAGI